MNLVNRIKGMFMKRTSPVAPELEHLTLSLMPREVVAKTKAYKQPRGMVEEGEIEQYFTAYFEAFDPEGMYKVVMDKTLEPLFDFHTFCTINLI